MRGRPEALEGRRMAAGTISPVTVLRDARILRQVLRSALLRTRLMDDIDMIRTSSGDFVSQTLGTPLVRKEDPALLSGRGRYADDFPVPNGTLHAHVIRSPHAHAKILRIDAAAAKAHPGVFAVITGEDVRKLTDPFLIALKQPVHQWSLAVDRVRYVGEAVALVVAQSRYIAEDAAELVQVDYESLAAVIDPIAACDKSAPLLHPECRTNEISVRKFAYGDTAAAFAGADARVALTVDF